MMAQMTSLHYRILSGDWARMLESIDLAAVMN